MWWLYWLIYFIDDTPGVYTYYLVHRFVTRIEITNKKAFVRRPCYVRAKNGSTGIFCLITKFLHWFKINAFQKLSIRYEGVKFDRQFFIVEYCQNSGLSLSLIPDHSISVRNSIFCLGHGKVLELWNKQYIYYL